MYKKIISLSLCLLGGLLCFTACNFGTAYDADSEKGYAEAIELLKKNIETNRYKIYFMEFATSAKVGNNLETVTVKMVNDHDLAFSQKFLLVGNQKPYPMESVASTFEAPLYKSTKGIDLSKLSAKDIISQIDAAKKLIPEGSEFRAIDKYTISETVPAGNESFNEGKTFGEQSTTFNIAFTQEIVPGQEGVAQARVIVSPDGSVALDI